MTSKGFCLQCFLPLVGCDQKKFCSSSCSARYNNRLRTNRTKESRLLTSVAVRKSLGVSDGPYARIYLLKCQVCEEAYYRPRRGSRVCSKSCQSLLESQRRLGKPNPKSKYSGKRISRVEYHYYRTLAEFKLKPKDLLRIKGYDLFREFGIWSVNNKRGVVRDHILSTKDGWVQEIDPAIISHPANCQFLSINENSTKGDKSWITYSELLYRIQGWPS